MLATDLSHLFPNERKALATAEDAIQPLAKALTKCKADLDKASKKLVAIKKDLNEANILRPNIEQEAAAADAAIVAAITNSTPADYNRGAKANAALDKCKEGILSLERSVATQQLVVTKATTNHDEAAAAVEQARTHRDALLKALRTLEDDHVVDNPPMAPAAPTSRKRNAPPPDAEGSSAPKQAKSTADSSAGAASASAAAATAPKPTRSKPKAPDHDPANIIRFTSMGTNDGRPTLR